MSNYYKISLNNSPFRYETYYDETYHCVLEKVYTVDVPQYKYNILSGKSFISSYITEYRNAFVYGIMEEHEIYEVITGKKIPNGNFYDGKLSYNGLYNVPTEEVAKSIKTLRENNAIEGYIQRLKEIERLSIKAKIEHDTEMQNKRKSENEADSYIRKFMKRQ